MITFYFKHLQVLKLFFIVDILMLVMMVFVNSKLKGQLMPKRLPIAFQEGKAFSLGLNIILKLLKFP